ncbi:MAG: hypothetical protein ABGX25_02375 [Nautiliaceae bacterium]
MDIILAAIILGIIAKISFLRKILLKLYAITFPFFLVWFVYWGMHLDELDSKTFIFIAGYIYLAIVLIDEEEGKDSGMKWGYSPGKGWGFYL